MASVVIIHAADDALPARALGEKLRLTKLTPVFETAPGQERQNAIKSAAVTIALWSPRSVSDSALEQDATFARGKNKLIHAGMQSAQPPGAFRGDKWVNLTGWRGEDDFDGWRELAKLVTDKAGVPLPPPPPRPPSGFFQPGRVDPTAEAAAEAQARRDNGKAAPQQRGGQQQQQQRQQTRQAPPPQQPRAAQSQRAPAPQRERSGGGPNMMVIGAIVFVVIALLGGGGYYFMTQSQGGQSAAAWEAVEQNNAASLRAFIAGNPGDYRDDAETALAALEERSYEAASDADSIEAFQAFLTDFPQSEHALAARGRIAELQAVQSGAPVATDPAATPTPATNPDLVPPGATAGPGGPAPLTPAPEPETPTDSEEPSDTTP